MQRCCGPKRASDICLPSRSGWGRFSRPALYEQMVGGLESADWLTRREIVRALVKQIEVSDEQIRIVYRVNAPTLGRKIVAGVASLFFSRPRTTEAQPCLLAHSPLGPRSRYNLAGHGTFRADISPRRPTMAGFQKFGKLSTNGWDAKTQTQTITLGQHAQIGLWGGGPNGEDLDVMAGDQSMCVVHEQNPPAGYPHMRQFVLTALRLGETKINAFLPGTNSRYSEPITVKVVGQPVKKLVFFPGERKVGSATMGTIYAVGSGETIEAAG